jgi:hypothetical protein
VGSRYLSGGIVMPNPIVEEVPLYDYPDTYVIPYTMPQPEEVAITVHWVSNAPFYVAENTVTQLATGALVDYINSIPVGTSPINYNDLTQVFIDAVASVLPSENVISLQFAVSVGGIGVGPDPGPPQQNVVWGDPNSYFLTDTSQITIIGASTEL